MNFSGLPWFIRKEIIDFVIEKHKGYRFVNKEWLECVVRRHGILSFGWKANDTRVTPLVKKFIEKISFDKFHDIDWETVHRCICVKNVYTYFEAYHLVHMFDSFLENFLKLPPLRQLYFGGSSMPQLDITSVLKKQLPHLETLSLNVGCFEFGDVGDLNSSSISTLFLDNIKRPVAFNKLPRAMPNLKRFILHGVDLDEAPQLVFDTFENVYELDLEALDPYLKNFNPHWTIEDTEPEHPTVKYTEFDLSKFPKLSKLSLKNGIEPMDDTPIPAIEKLAISGSMEYVRRVISKSSTNQKKLDVYFSCGFLDREARELIEFILSREALTTLRLSGGYKFDRYESFPIGSKSIVDLELVLFSLTSNFLIWLSKNFNLKRLKLLYCEFKEIKRSKHISFDSLECVIITCKAKTMKQFKKYLNPGSCKNAATIEYNERDIGKVKFRA